LSLIVISVLAGAIYFQSLC